MAEQLRPDLFGKQMSPSKDYTWFGNYGGRGTRFSGNQQHEMKLLGIDRETVKTVACTMRATQAEFSWSKGQEAPVYTFECPIVEKTRSGLVKVITPNGSLKWAPPNGKIERKGGRGA